MPGPACPLAAAECYTVYRPEAVLPVLTKCLEIPKVQRARNLVLDAFMATVMGGGPSAAAPPVNAGQIRQGTICLPYPTLYTSCPACLLAGQWYTCMLPSMHAASTQPTAVNGLGRT